MQITPRCLRVDIRPKQIDQHVPWHRSATLSEQVTDDPRRLRSVPTLDELAATEQTEAAEEADSQLRRTCHDGWTCVGLRVPPGGSVSAAVVHACDLRSICICPVTRSSRCERRFRKPGKSPEDHVEGATRLALGGERLLVRQPVLIKLIMLLPPTSRYLLSSGQDGEEGPVAGDLRVQSGELLHDFRWADGRKSREDVVNVTMRIRGGFTTPRSPSRAHYPIPGHSTTPSRSSVEPAASCLDCAPGHAEARSEEVAALCANPAFPSDACWVRPMTHLRGRPGAPK